MAQQGGDILYVVEVMAVGIAFVFCFFSVRVYMYF